MSQFSHRILNEVRTTDVGPVGESLNGLMSKLKSVNADELNPENQSKFKRLFKRTKASVNEIFSKMQSVGSQIDRISIELDKHKNNLKQDVGMLDELYDMNKDYFDELSLFIEAESREETKFNRKRYHNWFLKLKQLEIKWMFKRHQIWNNLLIDWTSVYMTYNFLDKLPFKRHHKLE